MPPTTHIEIKGGKELEKAFRQMRKEVLAEMRPELIRIAGQVRADAEQRAFGNITNIGTEWGKMRVGVTVKGVYVAPKLRNRGGSRRPNFSALLLVEAMQPAQEAWDTRVREEFDVLINVTAAKHGFL